MKKVLALLVAVVVVGLSFAPAVLAGTGKTHDLTATVVSVDMAKKTITITDDKGENHTAPILGKAMAEAKTVKAGDKVKITCQDNAKGEHEGVTAISVVAS